MLGRGQAQVELNKEIHSYCEMHHRYADSSTLPSRCPAPFHSNSLTVLSESAFLGPARKGVIALFLIGDVRLTRSTRPIRMLSLDTLDRQLAIMVAGSFSPFARPFSIPLPLHSLPLLWSRYVHQHLLQLMLAHRRAIARQYRVEIRRCSSVTSFVHVDPFGFRNVTGTFGCVVVPVGTILVRPVGLTTRGAGVRASRWKMIVRPLGGSLGISTSRGFPP